MNLQDVGHDIKQLFGGVLRCAVCGRERQLGNVGDKLANGWPKCCGYTMTWITQKQLDERQEARP